MPDFESEESFFDVYEMGLKTKGWTYTTLHNAIYEKKHVHISMGMLESWGEKRNVPSYQSAKVVLEVLDVTVTDEDILDMISCASDEKVLNISGGKVLREKLNIFLPSLLKDKSLEEIRDELEERIFETKIDGAKNFNDYVTELIKYDLENHILPLDHEQVTLIGTAKKQA